MSPKRLCDRPSTNLSVDLYTDLATRDRANRVYPLTLETAASRRQSEERAFLAEVHRTITAPGTNSRHACLCSLERVVFCLMECIVSSLDNRRGCSEVFTDEDPRGYTRDSGLVGKMVAGALFGRRAPFWESFAFPSGRGRKSFEATSRFRRLASFFSRSTCGQTVVNAFFETFFRRLN